MTDQVANFWGAVIAGVGVVIAAILFALFVVAPLQDTLTAIAAGAR